MKPEKQNDARLLRMKQVQELTGLSRSSIYGMSSAGNFPSSLQLVPGGTSVAWVAKEIEDWVNQRIEARDEEVSHD